MHITDIKSNFVSNMSQELQEQKEKLTFEQKILAAVKKERKRKDVSQDEMSKILNISRAQYGNYESGKSKLSVVALVTICSSLGIKVLLVDGDNILN